MSINVTNTENGTCFMLGDDASARELSLLLEHHRAIEGIDLVRDHRYTLSISTKKIGSTDIIMLNIKRDGDRTEEEYERILPGCRNEVQST